MLELRFIQKQPLSATTWEFTFAPLRGKLDYLPGQYADFTMPGLGSRVMTLVSHPSQPSVAFATRLREPLSEYKQQLTALMPGSIIMLGAPLGDMILPRSDRTPLIFIAGGVGIASFIAMLHDITLSGSFREVHLLYAYHSLEDRTYGGLLDTFPFASKREFVSPHRLTVTDILTASSAPTESLYYLSGTESFVESIRGHLETAGLDHSQIVFDYFTGY